MKEVVEYLASANPDSHNDAWGDSVFNSVHHDGKQKPSKIITLVDVSTLPFCFMGSSPDLFSPSNVELEQKMSHVFAIHWETFGEIIDADSIFATIVEKQTELLLNRYKRDLYSL